jgi:peptidoglycan/LPS O-acetylase OafA/YrhL
MNRAIHVRELDGVRGLAILLVLITHFGGYGQEAVGPLGRAFHAVVDFGWSGVDLFFVLSGFLITGILLEAKGSPAYFRSFYMRRVLRILPLYYLAVCIYFFLLIPSLRVLAPGRASVVSAVSHPVSEQLWYFVHLSNWRIGRQITFNGIDHFWSLAIEEQFYLVWPLIVLALSRRALLRVCGVLIVFSFALRNLPSVLAIHAVNPHWVYCATPFRLDALAFGAGLSVLVLDQRFRRDWRLWACASLCAGVALVVVAYVRSGSASFESVPMAALGFTGVALAYSALVGFAAMRAGTAAAAFLRSPALLELGRLSYGIYVAHRPLSILAPGLQTALARHIGGVPASLTMIVTGGAISYGLALVSWRLIERPFLRLKDRFPYGAPKASPIALVESTT